MTDATSPATYAVVYQFGKVASTSVVAMLNQCPDVLAVQSHFLGARALEKLIPRLVDPKTDAYFHFHLQGQFNRNLEVTRRINQLRMGKIDGERLLMLSIAREPLEWFRSAFTQDVVGYLPRLRRFALANGVSETASDELILSQAVPKMLAVFEQFIEGCGGVDQTIVALKQKKTPPELKTSAALSAELIELLYISLRPFDWYQLHYKELLDHRIEDYRPEDGYWRRDQGDNVFAVMTYEALEPALADLGQDLGLDLPPKLPRENTSQSKPHSTTLRTAFAEAPLEGLRQMYAKSTYSQFFGYR